MDVDLKEVTPGIVEVREAGTELIIGIMVKTSKQMEYGELIGEIICERIASGEMVTKVCKSKGMPSYSTLMKWVSKNEEFAEMFSIAKQERADTYFDAVLDEANDALDATKDSIAINKLRSDTYKWAAAVSKPSEYGKQTKVTGEIGVGIIKVETGIRRPGDELSEREVGELNGSTQITGDGNTDTPADVDNGGSAGENFFD